MNREGAADTVERWAIFDLELRGPAEGNPFTEVTFGGRFRQGHHQVHVDGFYDGDGSYHLRFMPDALGEWEYVTESNRPELAGLASRFRCVPPGPGNHGPVGVRNAFHFVYADGRPYFEVGTTCYAWVHQGDTLEEHTLATLRHGPFNKLRMCVFPKDYHYNENEPPFYPFEPSRTGGWDWERFSPPFFRHFERRVGDLLALGIEADLILFHPYDRWGYANMGQAADERYLRYLVARLAPYRNVWWSMANEYDLMPSKTMADWDGFFRLVQQSDPYQHPRSIHNCHGFYDHAKPWVTHQSIQRSDVEQTRTWRELYRKPVVIDECCYEGNIPERWGDISPQEMVRRFWEATVRGGYAGHGETYLHPQDILWWSKGGALHGSSPARLAFLRGILEEGPAQGLDPQDGIVRYGHPCAGQAGSYYLVYFGLHQPARAQLSLPAGGRYRAEVIDTWEMSISPPEIAEGDCVLALPGRPYMAIRLRREP